ncbi:hypothetical protein K435DRAFT_850303 [Dendrothele bispora CBS 962.96]|uniref:Uncharacterized protein n=1 Tax=Dendrothele bispora (strain CBS 962.96) TaxID=1314807 RepID=A0A4S8MQD6_DENBC|nr:hypothetical protein K435DRAFT_850303 [Dendrothele bispora CBS 962.96]
MSNEHLETLDPLSSPSPRDLQWCASTEASVTAQIQVFEERPHSISQGPSTSLVVSRPLRQTTLRKVVSPYLASAVIYTLDHKIPLYTHRATAKTQKASTVPDDPNKPLSALEALCQIGAIFGDKYRATISQKHGQLQQCNLILAMPCNVLGTLRSSAT